MKTRTTLETPLKVDWNMYSVYYDSLNALTPYKKLLEQVTSLVKKRNHLPILDAGCGTGNLIRRLIEEKLPSRMITGLDASKEMLCRLQRKCKVKTISANLNATLPFTDETFGTVVCVNALYAVEKPSETIKEFFRILKPGGSLIIVSPKKGYENGIILKEHCKSIKPEEYWKNAHASEEREKKLITEALSKNKKIIKRMLSIACINREISKNKRFHFFTQNRLKSLLSKTNFLIDNYSLTYANQSHIVEVTKPKKSPLLETGIVYPNSLLYKRVSLFAKKIYREKYQTSIKANPDVFVYARQDKSIIGCFGLYTAVNSKPLLFETYVPNAYRLISGKIKNRNLLAELGTKVIAFSEETTSNKNELTLVLTALLIIEAYKIGIEYVGFTTNRLAKRVTDILGFELISLGKPDLSNKTKKFLSNWKKYFHIPQFCFGFHIKSISQCEAILKQYSDKSIFTTKNSI